MIIGTGGGCVPSGRFSREEGGWEVALGPGNSTEGEPHCLVRDFDIDVLEAGSREVRPALLLLLGRRPSAD